MGKEVIFNDIEYKGSVNLPNASTVTKGIVNQTTAQSNISNVDLANLTASDVPTVVEWINGILIPMVNAIKASQNTELTNQRAAGQQSNI